MATSEEKQELIDDIKRPIRYYRIRLYGYGSEIVYGKSSKEEYEYWQDINARCNEMNLDPEENDNPFQVYMFEKEEKEDLYEFVPNHIKREGEWYEQDDCDHASGVATNACRVEIVEVESDEYGATEIETIVGGEEFYDTFYDAYEPEIVIGDSEAYDHEYVFFGLSAEKGVFFDGIIETQGKIDISKLKFFGTEFPNGDDLIYDIEYDGSYIDNNGGDTNGKGLYIEIQKL